MNQHYKAGRASRLANERDAYQRQARSLARAAAIVHASRRNGFVSHEKPTCLCWEAAQRGAIEVAVGRFLAGSEKLFGGEEPAFLSACLSSWHTSAVRAESEKMSARADASRSDRRLSRSRTSCMPQPASQQQPIVHHAAGGSDRNSWSSKFEPRSEPRHAAYTPLETVNRRNLGMLHNRAVRPLKALPIDRPIRLCLDVPTTYFLVGCLPVGFAALGCRKSPVIPQMTTPCSNMRRVYRVTSRCVCVRSQLRAAKCERKRVHVCVCSLFFSDLFIPPSYVQSR